MCNADGSFSGYCRHLDDAAALLRAIQRECCTNIVTKQLDRCLSGVRGGGVRGGGMRDAPIDADAPTQRRTHCERRARPRPGR